MIRLLPGDCREVLATLPADSVHCVVDNVTTLRYNAGMNDIPIDVLAYCAGVIDSDGSIGVRRSTYAKRVRGDARNPIYAARISIKQVEPQAVTLLKETFGGSLYVQQNVLPNGRALYTWDTHSRQAALALKLLLPFLRIKKRQAENCLALYALMDGASRTKQLGTRDMQHWTGKIVTVRTMGHTDEHVAACEALYLKGKQLNAVGVKGEADECQTTGGRLSRGAVNAA